MPQYKVYYFDFRGKGELLRIIFEVAGVKYENIRLPAKEWSPAKKDELGLPYGQLPVLSIDGVNYCQTMSIARYLADEFGINLTLSAPVDVYIFSLAGKTNLEKLRADMVAHCMDDFAWKPIYIYRENDAKIKAEKTLKYKTEDLPVDCAMLEKLLQENQQGKGFFVGDSLTYADITYYTYISMTSLIGIDPSQYLPQYPTLHALYNRVQAVPAIKSWLDKRPHDSY